MIKKLRISLWHKRRLIFVTFTMAVLLVGWLILSLSLHASINTTASLQPESGSLTGCVNSFSDSLASGNKAVKFGGCDNGNDPANLDASGGTIPDTNYAIPAGSIFMSTSGSNSNSGTKASPVETLKKAIHLVPSDGTIVVRGGTYREGQVGTTKSFTLQAYPYEKAWFDGTNVISGSEWTNDGSGHWYVNWETPDFCGNKYYSLPYNNQTSPTCSWGDTNGSNGDYGDSQNPAATDPQMVFINGVYMHEVTSLSQVTPGSDNFFYDQMGTHRIYIAQDPSTHTVEATKYPVLLKMQGGSGGNIIRGLGFTRYASDVYSGNATHGALVVVVPDVTLERNVFSRQAGTAVMLADPRNTIIKGNIFAYNGFDGLEANGHSSSSNMSIQDNLVVEGNVFNSNNNERYGCGYACGIANMKYNHMDGGTVKNNIFENGVAGAKGFWCDENCNNMVIVNNVMRGNTGDGLFFEVSDTSIIASNLIYGNSKSGLRVAAANTKVYNNTAVDNGAGAIVYDDARQPDGAKYGPNTANNHFMNNIFSSNGGKDACARIALLDTCNAGGQTDADDYFKAGKLDYNVYLRTSGVPSTLAIWQTTSTKTYSTLSAFKTATSKEPHGQEISSASDPLFVDSTNGDYRIASGSVAKDGCSALPSGVAAAVGVSVTSSTDCGAISWPGRQ